MSNETSNFFKHKTGSKGEDPKKQKQKNLGKKKPCTLLCTHPHTRHTKHINYLPSIVKCRS